MKMDIPAGIPGLIDIQPTFMPNREPPVAGGDTIQMAHGTRVPWPDHAIAGTPNAAIRPAIGQRRIGVIIRKGFRPDLDSYPAFFENDRTPPAGREGRLRQSDISHLFLCGPATDFCVTRSVLDACKGVGMPDTDGQTAIDTARRQLAEAGVAFVNSDDV